MGQYWTSTHTDASNVCHSRLRWWGGRFLRCGGGCLLKGGWSGADTIASNCRVALQVHEFWATGREKSRKTTLLCGHSYCWTLFVFLVSCWKATRLANLILLNQVMAAEARGDLPPDQPCATNSGEKDLLPASSEDQHMFGFWLLMFEHFDSSLCFGYMKGFGEKQFWTETILERINFGEN